MPEVQQPRDRSEPTGASARTKGRIRIRLHSCTGVPSRKKLYLYYISLRLDSPGEPLLREKSLSRSISAEGTVTWDEDIYMDGHRSSSLRLRLYETHEFMWDKVVCELNTPLDLLLSRDEASLTSKSGVTVLLRLTVTEVRDGGRQEMVHVITDTQAPAESHTALMASQLDNAASAAMPVVAIHDQWGPLLEKISAVADIAKAIAEIHPYTSIAWSVMSAGYELVKKQNDRDEAVAKLVEALNSTYDVVLAGDSLLNASITQRKAISTLVKQTIECGHFVRSYLKKGFWGRAVRVPITSVDKDIEEFRQQLGQLQASLVTHSALVVQRDVHLILGNSEAMADNVDLLDMQYTKTARWRSGKRCLPGTRVALISEVLQWAHSFDDDAPRILLLTGVAGVGKSSVSHTIASKLEDSHHLAASYCFDRNDPEHHRPSLLFPTIARHLADTHLPFKHALVHANSAATFGTPDLEDQFENLLLKPLRDLTYIGPLVIVIDALDESGDVQTRALMLTILSKRFPELPRNFRLLLTSRPEDDVMKSFDDKPHVLCKTVRSAANDDVTAYIASKLVDRDGRPLPTFTYDDYIRLSNKSEGLFQWATIACTAIVHGNNRNLPPTSKQMRDSFERFVSLSSGALDYIYYHVLELLLPEPSGEDVIFLKILGFIVTSKEPITSNTIFELLQLADDERESMDIFLRGLGAVLTGVTSRVQEPIRTSHSSFRDFLLGGSRTGRFHVDESSIQRDMASMCLKVLDRDLHFNMFGIESSYFTHDDMRSRRRLGESVPATLAYAACYAVAHTTHSVHNPMEATRSLLEQYFDLLSERFLPWLELASILGDPSDFVHLHSSLSLLIKDKNLDIGGKIELARSCSNLIEHSRSAIDRSIPHIYLSAYALYSAIISTPHIPSSHEPYEVRGIRRLPVLAPSSLGIPGRFGSPQVECAVLSPDNVWMVLGFEKGTLEVWNARHRTFEGYIRAVHGDAVTVLAFSPDSAQFTTGSKTGISLIWSIDSKGKVKVRHLLILNGHTARINSMAFSPDARFIASGSSDCTIRLWNAKEGTYLNSVSCTSGICSVVFSPDGSQLAFGLYNNMVHVWDSQLLEPCFAPLAGHRKQVHSVAFSSDGKTIISGAHYGAIYVWDSWTGVLMQKRPCIGRTEDITSVSISPDGLYIASVSWQHNTVYVWSTQGAESGGPLFTNNTTGRAFVAFAHEGQIISSCRFGTGFSRMYRVRIWNINEPGRATRMHTFAPDTSFALRDYPNDSNGVVTRAEPEECPLLPAFRLERDGFVKDITRSPPNHLIFIPEQFRKRLYLPPMTHIFSPHPTYQLDLSDFAHGTRWTDIFHGDSPGGSEPQISST
ncbi:unnamed protein product [Peniophora sp. CBMAI 1063]|nr:unnamed protein product [Peniophora sp. CBMAI 1063]